MISQGNSNLYGYLSDDISSKSKEDSSLNLNILPIINLNEPSIHYRCPKCYNFPIIEFKKNQEYVSYICACSKDSKYISIKDLFAQEKKFLTFLNNRNLNKNKGLLCTIHKSDYSNKNRKFKYFCINCNINICKDCLLYHLGKSHDVINLEIQKLEMNKKIISIHQKLNEIKKENEESDKFSFDEDEINIIEFEELENGNLKKIDSKKKKVIFSNFIELIYIIINDYINYPNYYHFNNIQNIYNILFDKEIEIDEDKNISQLKNLEGTILLSYDDGEDRSYKCSFRFSIKGIHDNLSNEQKISIFRGKNIFSCNFIYHGKTIEIIERLEDIINEEDIEKKIAKFFVIEKEKMKEKIKSKDIICPECKESIFMNVKDYKIHLFDCINGHKIDNIFLDEFQKEQYINLSTIICNTCKKTKGMLFNFEFYRCITCKINICSLCENNHDKNHKIIMYDEKNYICKAF